MPRKGYPPEFRRRALDLIASGRKVVDVARDLGISDQTLYTWRRQERIDRGELPGLTSAEQGELTAARRRIKELEDEVAIHRSAAELLKERTAPKVGSRRSR
jgi:transposase